MALKSLSELLEGDDRQRMFGSVADLHHKLDEFALSASVPEHVRTLFDTARNLSLCTWYVYEFHPIAELTAFLALEAALKARAKSSALATETSFKALIQHAVDAGWIAEERIAHRRDIARSRVEDRKTLASIRRLEDLRLDSIGVEEPSEQEIAAEESEMKILDGVIAAAINLRDGLARGEAMVAPGSHRRLRITADLINQLYSS